MRSLQAWSLARSPWRAHACAHRVVSSIHLPGLVNPKPSCSGSLSLPSLVPAQGSRVASWQRTSNTACCLLNKSCLLELKRINKERNINQTLLSHPPSPQFLGSATNPRLGRSFICFKVDVYRMWPDLRHWQFNVIIQCFYYLRMIRKVLTLPKRLNLGQKISFPC